MEFTEVVARRRMVRAYRPDPVNPAMVDRILQTATRAPSAGFSQPHRFVVIESAEGRSRIAQACGEPAAIARGLAPWLSVAPVHVIPCVEPAAYERRYAEADKATSGGPSSWSVPFAWVDGGAAFMLVLLAAVDEGLGAGFLAVDDASLAAAVDLPDGWRPLGLLTLGHPLHTDAVGSSARRLRLPMEEVIARR